MNKLVEEALEQLEKAKTKEEIEILLKARIREAYEAGYYEGIEVGKETKPMPVGY